MPYPKATVCSAHFIGNKKSDDPRSPSYLPTVHPVSHCRSNSVVYKSERFSRFLNRESRQCDQTVNVVSGEFENIVHTNTVSCQTDVNDALLEDSFSIYICTIEENQCCTQVTHKPKKIKIAQTETQTEKITEDKQCGDSTRPSVFCGYETVKHNETALKDLTSVSFNVFALLLNMLPRGFTTTRELTWENRLLIFLIKLKTNLTFTFVGTIFGVSSTTASNAFKSVLCLLAAKTKEWILFPSKQAVLQTMPLSFKENFNNCRIIIDCTEIKTEKPPGVDNQVLMYSQYKSTWTVKYLIAINPCGFICFVSKGYGGRSTDVFITNDCGVLRKLEPGDLVLADKRFPNISMKENTVIVMPPFAERNQKQFSESQMEETYKIASVRIHVERAIQRLKIFNILQNRLTVDLFPYIDDIVHLCAVLVNLQPPIITT